MTAKLQATTTPVQIKFDPDQEYQRDAIESVLDLFKGQPLAATSFEIDDVTTGQGSLLSEYGLGNQLQVADEQIKKNLTAVQDRNQIPAAFRRDDEEGLASYNFSVEMETGTGKTYVYLRTIIELHRVYGLSKFVIVVPSVAIREGVQASLRLLKDHFAGLYDGVQYDTWRYDSKNPARLRSFAQANYLQILIINIDAFNKADRNRIHQTQDQMMGRAPVEFLRACNPVVIMDEPQNMESATAKEAIASLNPLVTLRYSATHRNTYQQVYRLTPVDAYNLGLVKRIEVWSVLEDENSNRPYVKVVKINANTRGVTAQVEMDVVGSGGAGRKVIKCGSLSDLRELSGIASYDGYVVEEINAGSSTVLFANGVEVSQGGVSGLDRDQIQRAQLRTAVIEHFDRELDIQRRVAAGEIAPMKVLSLFFIDRVANYVPGDGKFRTWFEEEYVKALSSAKYASLSMPVVGEAHDGYFSVDRRGGAKNTNGSTKDDDLAYELIMRDKERLLSVDEPLRFIFSHSALREGWDNPNVFVICTLNQAHSDVKKRQEIGRGLRLPVMADGNRCTDPQVARLAVIANESYDEFASALQREIEHDTGVEFPKANVKKGRDRKTVNTRKGYDSDSDFLALWDRIKHRTTYRVQFSTEDLVKTAATALGNSSALSGSYMRAKKSTIAINESGVSATLMAEKAPTVIQNYYPIPDLLGHLTRHVQQVSRSTIAKILIGSGRLGDASTNPQQFLDDAKTAIDKSLAELLVKGIDYERIGAGPEAVYEMRLFEERTISAYLDNLVDVGKGVYHEVAYDSELEKQIALALDLRQDVKIFVKLPGWFTIDTPVGRYNPDWAIVKTDNDGVDRLFLIRESKPHRDLTELRPDERLKVLFGKKHFDALSVDFGVIDSPEQI
jgi:type III restriction enzyme